MRRISNLLDSRERDPGTLETKEFNSLRAGEAIQLGETSCVLVVDRGGWPVNTGTPRGVVDGIKGVGPDSEVVVGEIWLSLDNGTTWDFAGGVGSGGGDHLLRSIDGRPREVSTKTTLRVKVPEPDNPNRRVRIRLHVRARLTTACHMELS